MVIFKATLGSGASEVAWGPSNKSDSLSEIWESKEQEHFHFLVVVKVVNCER